MKRRLTRYRVAPALVLVLLSAVEWPILAQQGTAAQQDLPAAPQGPQPMDEGEIPGRAEFVAADLRRIEILIQPSAEIASIGDALIVRDVRIVTLLAQLDSINPTRVSARRIEGQRLPWLELEAEVVSWESVVQARFVDLQRASERLREERARWELTADRADAAEVAPELLLRIDATLVRLLEVESRVRDRRNEVSALADRLTTSQEQVAESEQRLDSMAAGLRSRLFDRNALPLWRSLGTVQTTRLADEAVQASRDWWNSLFAYASLRRGSLSVLMVWFGVLLFGALRLRRRSRASRADTEAAEPDADATDPVRQLIDRPFAMALALVLSITVLTLPFPVGSASDLVLVLAVLAAIRVGAVVLEPPLVGALYGVAALAILSRIVALGPAGSPFTRILWLFVTSVALAGIAWMTIRVRRTPPDQGGWRRAASAVTSVAMILLAVALAANVFGWMGLSKLLTEATVASLFAAIAWAVVVTAITTVLPVVLDGDIGRMLPSLRRRKTTVCYIVGRIVVLAAVIGWSHRALLGFQLWQPVRTLASSVAESGFSVGGLIFSTGRLVGTVLILVATWLLARLAAFVMREEVLPRLHMGRGAGNSVVTLTNYTIYGVGIVLAASAIGLGGTQLTVVIGALGVGIGFGMQNIVNNFVSGLILIFERPIKVGDLVQTANHLGKVEQIGIRACTIRSLDGAEIIVPNGDLIARDVINWTRSDELRRIEVLVGVAYGTEPERVFEILRSVAVEHPLVLEEPELKAQMVQFGESSLDFRLRCWTQVDVWIDVLADLHVAINKGLKEAGVTIPFPQRDLHVRSTAGADEDAPRRVIGAVQGSD